MRFSTSRKLILAYLALVALPILVLLGPLIFGVWLPDVFGGDPRTLAEASTAGSGYRFRVVQYWNHVDFYSTELHVQGPDGENKVHTLDGDDDKSWRVPMRVDEADRSVTVTLSGSRLRTLHW